MTNKESSYYIYLSGINADVPINSAETNFNPTQEIVNEDLPSKYPTNNYLIASRHLMQNYHSQKQLKA